MARKLSVEYYPGAIYHESKNERVKKVSVNGIDIFLLEAQDAAWLASYESSGISISKKGVGPANPQCLNSQLPGHTADYLAFKEL